MPKKDIHPKMQKLDYHMNNKFLFSTFSTLNTKDGKFYSEANLDTHPAYNPDASNINESNTQVMKFRQQARAINYSSLTKKDNQ